MAIYVKLNIIILYISYISFFC